MALIVFDKKNEEGSVLVAATLFMIILTLIGTMAMNTSTVEHQIAANDKFHTIVFQNADSGIYAAPKVIAACEDSGSEDILPNPIPQGIKAPDANNDPILMDADDGTAYKTLYRKIRGYDAHDGEADFMMTLDGNSVGVDVQNFFTDTLEGGGAEFGAGAEGPGTGSVGSTYFLYREISTASGQADSTSTINAVYRKVFGIPGGL